MSDKNKGIKYTLTILYNPDDDQCEYIQEELIDDTSDDSWIYGGVDLKDYFSDSDLSDMVCCKVGKA